MSQRGVIFDMDGVLIDSYRAHFASWRTLYGELGISYDEQQFAADFGRTSRDILGRKFGAVSLMSAKSRCFARYSVKSFR